MANHTFLSANLLRALKFPNHFGENWLCEDDSFRKLGDGKNSGYLQRWEENS